MLTNQSEQMNDTELIDLMRDYGIKDTEISQIINKLTSRDFENVLNYIENYKKEQGDRKEDDRKKTLKEIAKINDLQKIEAERNERYRKLLKEKIAANRLEQQQKDEIENYKLDTSEKPIIIDAPIRVGIYLYDGSELCLGFSKESTINDLYEKFKMKPILT